jgi:8-oxo-dGTP diphosphatase
VSCSAKEGLRVLLVRRGNPPFAGSWALPGGFVEETEDLPAACLRELEEETGIKPSAILQLGAWGKPGRDPRGRTVSVVHFAAVRPEAAKPRAGGDAAEAQWCPAGSLPQLAFDHEDIVRAALEKLPSLVSATHFVFALLPERFRLEDLRDALTATGGELVTAQEALAFAKRARVVKLAGLMPREGESYQCAAADFLVSLR